MSGWLWLLLALILTAATLYAVYVSDKRAMHDLHEKPKEDDDPEDWPPIDWYGYP